MTPPFDRRTFLLSAAACAAVATAPARAQTAAKLEESDPQAIALGYKHDTTKVDDKKFPKHAKDQRCDGCQFFTGKPAEAWGPCAIFGGKNVSAVGWCNSWVKKAG
jgi:hypothetical protein